MPARAPLRAAGRRATAGAATLVIVLATAVAAACGGGADAADPVSPVSPAGPASDVGPGRGFPDAAPWAAFYGSAAELGDLARAAQTFRVLDLDADPDQGTFTAAQVASLQAGGARVISYLNLGACERFRTYWQTVPAGFVGCGANAAAQLGPYAGYPDEVWMNVGDPAYQHLILDYVAPRLVAQGVDGFFFDNLEVVEHDAASARASGQPVYDAACAQGGLDLVRKLRERYPRLLFVMQNATGRVTRLGTTGGVPFPTLLDGVSHEEVYAPYDTAAEAELLAWQALGLRPGSRAFWIATEDYVGSCADTAAARDAYTRSRARGFSPYAADASARQQQVCYWGF